jgi:hypothetical protein
MINFILNYILIFYNIIKRKMQILAATKRIIEKKHLKFYHFFKD